MTSMKSSAFNVSSTSTSTSKASVDSPLRAEEDKFGGTLPWILHHILERELSNELPLRIMFSFNAGHRLPKLRDVHKWWATEPKGRMIIEFLSSLPPLPPSPGEAGPLGVCADLTGSGAIPSHDNLSSFVAPGSQFFRDMADHCSAFTEEKRASGCLPFDFVKDFCLERVFKQTLKEVDFGQALPGLDYLRDTEIQRRACLREAAVRLNITKENWKDILTNDHDAKTWVELVQSQELEIEERYASVFLDLRIWIMTDMLKSPEFSKQDAIAMLNTLFPPTVKELPNDRINARSLQNYRNHFYRYIVSVKAEGLGPIEPFLNTVLKRGMKHSWSAARKNLEQYMDLCELMTAQAKAVHGIKFFQALSIHSKTNSSVHARTDSGTSSDRPVTASTDKSVEFSPLPRTPSTPYDTDFPRRSRHRRPTLLQGEDTKDQVIPYVTFSENKNISPIPRVHGIVARKDPKTPETPRTPSTPTTGNRISYEPVLAFHELTSEAAHHEAFFEHVPSPDDVSIRVLAHRKAATRAITQQVSTPLPPALAANALFRPRGDSLSYRPPPSDMPFLSMPYESILDPPVKEEKKRSFGFLRKSSSNGILRVGEPVSTPDTETLDTPVSSPPYNSSASNVKRGLFGTTVTAATTTPNLRTILRKKSTPELSPAFEFHKSLKPQNSHNGLGLSFAQLSPTFDIRASDKTADPPVQTPGLNQSSDASAPSFTLAERPTISKQPSEPILKISKGKMPSTVMSNSFELVATASMSASPTPAFTNAGGPELEPGCGKARPLGFIWHKEDPPLTGELQKDMRNNFWTAEQEAQWKTTCPIAKPEYNHYQTPVGTQKPSWKEDLHLIRKTARIRKIEEWEVTPEMLRDNPVRDRIARQLKLPPYDAPLSSYASPQKEALPEHTPEFFSRIEESQQRASGYFPDFSLLNHKQNELMVIVSDAQESLPQQSQGKSYQPLQSPSSRHASPKMSTPDPSFLSKQHTMDTTSGAHNSLVRTVASADKPIIKKKKSFGSLFSRSKPETPDIDKMPVCLSHADQPKFVYQRGNTYERFRVDDAPQNSKKAKTHMYLPLKKAPESEERQPLEFPTFSSQVNLVKSVSPQEISRESQDSMRPSEISFISESQEPRDLLLNSFFLSRTDSEQTITSRGFQASTGTPPDMSSHSTPTNALGSSKKYGIKNGTKAHFANALKSPLTRRAMSPTSQESERKTSSRNNMHLSEQEIEHTRNVLLEKARTQKNRKGCKASPPIPTSSPLNSSFPFQNDEGSPGTISMASFIPFESPRSKPRLPTRPDLQPEERLAPRNETMTATPARPRHIPTDGFARQYLPSVSSADWPVPRV